MSVEHELSELITNVSNAYDALSELGAEIPSDRNLENLTGTISTVPKGTSLAPALMAGATRIEDTIGDITTLREYAFYGQSTLEEVVLPNCSSFPTNAFSNCTALKSLTLGGVSIAMSNTYTSTYFPKLETLNLPGCTILSDRAFMSCSTLKEINIPNVTSVSTSAFYNCTSLETLDIGPCTYIGNSAFCNCTKLQSVDTAHVTSIGQYAFQHCDAFTSLEIPNITVMPYGGFGWMSNVSHISLANVESYASTTNTTLSNNYALRTVYLPKVSTFNPYMFQYCSSLSRLTDIYAPLVTTIPAQCFVFTGLTEIDDDKYTYIGTSAFDSCRSLQRVRFNKATQAGGFYCCYSLTEAHFPAAAPSSNDNFQSCSALTSVTYGQPGGILDRNHFYDCSSLTSLVCSPSIVSGYALYRCYKLTSLDLTNVSKIYASAFDACGLKSINLPLISAVPTDAFNGCRVEYLSLPNASGTLPSYACAHTAYLKSVYIPKITTLSASCFYNSGLSEIDLPAVTTLSTRCFANCKSLAKVVIHTSNCMLWNSSVFESTPIRLSSYLGYYGSVYVPAQYLEAYKTKSDWSKISARLVGY